MPQIPSKIKSTITFIPTDGGVVEQEISIGPVCNKLNEIITYLHADKKLRDEQFEAILKSLNAAVVVLNDLVDVEVYKDKE